MKTVKIVCLGGGIGTVNLIRGLKAYTHHLTVIVSAADNGGSAGRLRRLYGIFPPGDAMSCLAALLPPEKTELANLLTYRFPGDRYGKDEEIGGQKVGNLLFIGAKEVTGSVEKGLEFLENTFQSVGKILPSTPDDLHISALTVDNIRVEGEDKIDLGKYKGKRVLEQVFIHPENPTVSDEVLDALKSADVIIAGPGDLYTTILPVLLIPKIKEAVTASQAKKIYVINVANKPFETKDYDINHYVQAITKHLGTFPFETIIANDNFTQKIPSKYKYTYVKLDYAGAQDHKLVLGDLVDVSFPLYHDSAKLAGLVFKTI